MKNVSDVADSSAFKPLKTKQPKLPFISSEKKFKTCWGKPAEQSFKDTATIVCWNVNGICALLKKNKINELVEALDPDVICLSETKTHLDLIGRTYNRQIPKQFEQHWNCCKMNDALW